MLTTVPPGRPVSYVRREYPMTLSDMDQVQRNGVSMDGHFGWHGPVWAEAPVSMSDKVLEVLAGIKVDRSPGLDELCPRLLWEARK